ncbi:urease subunit beta [Nocardia sp. NPDC052566]|uniref:urease subunit beta n=1 Tax=Nocardia sp. NPDC052566 TaxID=3364330 RepID=UPI0037CA88CA
MTEPSLAPQAPLVPGEYLCAEGVVELNAGAHRIELDVLNTGDRPVQVGSHVHFPQSNAALRFDRAAAHGYRLDIPAGTAVRFEPGLGQRVSLVPLGGTREVYGISRPAPGRLDQEIR